MVLSSGLRSLDLVAPKSFQSDARFQCTGLEKFGSNNGVHEFVMYSNEIFRIIKRKITKNKNNKSK